MLGCWVDVVLPRVARPGLTENVTFEQRTEGSEGPHHVDIWRKSISARKNSQCKDLGQVCKNNRKEQSIEAELVAGRGIRVQSLRHLVSHWRTWKFLLGEHYNFCVPSV